jgi:hypothetical protein
MVAQHDKTEFFEKPACGGIVFANGGVDPSQTRPAHLFDKSLD